jgi:hypothetical protein
MKLLTAVISENFRKAGVFVLDKPFLPSLIFVGKAGAYQSKCTSLGLASGAVFTTLHFLRNLPIGPIS